MADGYVFRGTGKCRSCKAAILWWETPTHKRMPVDDTAAVVPDGEPLLEDGETWDQPDEVRRLLQNCHFATCPNAAEHRRARGGDDA